MFGRMIRRGTSALRRPIASLLYSWDDVQVGFLVSTGRTGTEFLADLFSSGFDRVDARHEPSPDMFDLGTGFIRSEISLDEAIGRFGRGRRDICKEVHRSGCEVYVESNNNLAYLIPVLRRYFRDYRIVHIVRDGRDVVRSWYSKTVPSPAQRGTRALFMSEEDFRRRLQAIDLADDPSRDHWGRMSRFERLCWLWAKKDGVIQDSIVGDKRAITVKFEDVFDRAAGNKGLWQVIEFLGLKKRMSVSRQAIVERTAVRLNRTEEHLLGKWTEWSPEQRCQFVTVAGGHMVRCGYQV